MQLADRKIAEIVTILGKIEADDLFWLCDVGAAGGAADRWSAFRPLLRTLAFEPNAAEFAKLSVHSEDKFINAAAAGYDGEGHLHITKYWSNSSMLKPNQEVIQTLEWGDSHEIMDSPMVPCLTLNTACASQGVAVDFLKVDTQGTELDILKGASEQMSTSVVCVEVEVEFCELYQGQPLFSEVDSYMRAQGFYLHELGNILSVKPRGKAGVGRPKGRLVSADALYFRKSDGPTISSRQWRALIVAYLAYGYSEEAIRLLEKAGDFDQEALALQLIPLVRKLAWTPKWLQQISGWKFLCRVGKRLWYRGAPVTDSHWDRPLGN